MGKILTAETVQERIRIAILREPLETRLGRYSIRCLMGRWRSTMRELSAEARLHHYARSLSARTRTGIHMAALYGALAVIAGVLFGTLSVHPF
jgi:hypothetical protein